MDNCFPSTGEPTGTYAGSQCPPNYTAACSDTKSKEGAVTCCPTYVSPSKLPQSRIC